MINYHKTSENGKRISYMNILKLKIPLLIKSKYVTLIIWKTWQKQWKLEWDANSKMVPEVKSDSSVGHYKLVMDSLLEYN